jgi:hypothetical protein
MSLAMYAAPFNDISNNNEDNTIMHKKKQLHNKTQKKYPKENFDTEKVNSVLDKIYNNLNDEDEDKNMLGDFNPPPMPHSAGVTRTKHTTEYMQNMTNQNNNIILQTLGRAPQPTNEVSDDLDMNSYNNYGDQRANEDYYKKVLPGYKPIINNTESNKPYYNINTLPTNNAQNPDILIQKLNYMINLLEEKQDERTNNVTEEVVLYSFLGIFIIFIVDSFARVGKYVR